MQLVLKRAGLVWPGEAEMADIFVNPCAGKMADKFLPIQVMTDFLQPNRIQERVSHYPYSFTSLGMIFSYRLQQIKPLISHFTLLNPKKPLGSRRGGVT